MDQTHEDLKALVAPYVLGAVPPEEEATVRSHLLTCDECRQEAEAFDGVTAALALVVERTPLPDGFVDRTMAKLAEERPEAATAPAPIRRRPLAWVFSAAALLVVALVVALVGFGGDGPSDESAVALLEKSGMDLSRGGVEAKLVETEDGLTLVARGLEAPPQGKTYELWQMKGACGPGQKGPCSYQPAVTFEPEDGVVVVEVDGALEDFDAAAVTVERGLVDEPTGAPVLSSF
ncbi:MAG: anti-sigma factor [Actinomycetota bacterium]|nr:anti-sigma factor [Actinomycetota bacterium]